MAKAPKTAKHAGGRPRTKTPATCTPAQLRKIDSMAMAQCKDTTIAESMGFSVDTFKAEFTKRTRSKRAAGKTKVLLAQYNAAVKTGTAVDRIWFGKQHLEQRDKADIAHGGLDEFLKSLATKD